MNFKTFFLITSILFVCADCSWCNGPWLLKKNQISTGFHFSFIPPVNRIHKSNFKTQYLHRWISDYNFNYTFNYGWTDQLELSFSLPTKFVASSSKLTDLQAIDFSDQVLMPADTVFPHGQLFDLGNLCLGLKYRITDKKFKSAIHIQFSWPSQLNDTYLKNGLRTAFPCWTFALGYSFGASNAKRYWYLDTGFAYRTHGYNPYFSGAFEIGWHIKSIIFALELAYNINIPLEKDDPVFGFQNISALYLNNQNYVALTLKLIIPVAQKWNVFFALGGGIWANNIQQGPSISCGFNYTFDL